MKTKDELIELINRLPDGMRFDDRIWFDLWRNGITPRADDPKTIYCEGKEIQMTKNPVMGFEIFEAAQAIGAFHPWQKILVEELPNGTSRIIAQKDEVVLRDHMKFSAIGL